MLKWIRSFFSSPKTKAKRRRRKPATECNRMDSSDVEGLPKGLIVRDDRNDERSIARIDFDQLADEDRAQISEFASEHSGIAVFEGEIEHGYSLAFAGHLEQCPRCQSETEQQYAHFIYTSQPIPRIMLAPAGYFCVACPTAVVDEEMLKQGVVGNYPFNGTVGMSPDGDEFVPFTTWNGQQSMYILEESGNVSGLSSVPRTGFRHGSSRKPKPKRMKVKRSQNVQAVKKKQGSKKRKRK